MAGTYIGGILEIFDMEDGGFVPSSIRYFFEPQYDYAKGATPKWVNAIPKTKIGFEDVFINDEAVYGLVWEVEKSSMSRHRPSVIRFDYRGEPKSRYTFDVTLESFAVDNDNTIYGVGFDAEGRYSLNRYNDPDRTAP